MIVARNGISNEFPWGIELGWVVGWTLEDRLCCRNTKHDKSKEQEAMTKTITGSKTVITLKATFWSVPSGPM